MKFIVSMTLAILFSISAQAYHETIDHEGSNVRGTWYVRPSKSSLPVPGNFYAYSGSFVTKELNCDQFIDKIHALISDWNKYPHINLYALTYCYSVPGGQFETDFIYAFDSWVPQAVPVEQVFYKDHQGMSFQGQNIDFSLVVSMDVKTKMTLSKHIGNNINPIHAASMTETVSGTDIWYPKFGERSKLVHQTSQNVFLKYIGDKFGPTEVNSYESALAGSDRIEFTDNFFLHLQNSQSIDFWFGFGDSRDCGSSLCFVP